MPKAGPAPDPSQRILRVFAFDPSRGARLDNRMTIRVPYEKLTKGPIGDKIAVIDYDASNDCYYEGIDLDASAVLGQSGLAPSESNPQFHQQMVYAVIMDTVRRFEAALGRKVKWVGDSRPKTEPFHGKLRVYPHAFQEANAFYDPKLRALLFGYFKASEEDAGSNLPGQIVFTCLSHDIVVHETTHAILHGIRPHFAEPTGPDATAFHEGFADIIALLQHFSFKETLLDTIQRTGGLIHRRQLAPDVAAGREGALIQAEVGEDNPIVDLARQFGEAMGNRKALRSALGTRPDPRALQDVQEPHERGAILVAAVFDAFFTIYINRTRDLIRIAYPDGRSIVPNFLHADLARLAEDAAKTANTIQNMCLRALDYCPPVDITFGDFLRAIVTADRDTVSEDRFGWRAAIINAFRARGIRPEGVISYSEDELSWDKYEGISATAVNPDFKRLFTLLNELEENPDPRRRRHLYRSLWARAGTFAMQLGLDPDSKLAAESINPLHQIRADGSLARRIVAEIVQNRKRVPIDPADPQAGTFTFRGGTTVLINRTGEVQYSISKPTHGPAGERRCERQREHLMLLADSFALAPYIAFDAAAQNPFRAVHRGY
ncbi:MAG TPA: hypothetical protein VEO54_16375 [Thermoanaerobaculia bacterium]|nr:hypothetical protein [Thermoanaerobaculia bacterium]